MRWNCPHCGTSLAVSDDKLSSSWSFSRCFQCAGFALVRRSDAQTIKTERAPSGESVLLPESSETPTAMLSQTALNNLNRILSKKNGAQAGEKLATRIMERPGSAPNIAVTPQSSANVDVRAYHPPAAKGSSAAQPAAPVIRPAIRRSDRPFTGTPIPTMIPQSLAPTGGAFIAHQQARIEAQSRSKVDAHALVQASPSIPTFPPKPPAQLPRVGLTLPEPLPEIPVRGTRQRLTSFLFGIGGCLAIGSGIYLYVQGQAIWEKSHTQKQASETVRTPPTMGVTAPAHAPVQVTPVNSGSANFNAEPQTTPASEPQTVVAIIARLHSGAMAPIRNIPMGQEPPTEMPATPPAETISGPIPITLQAVPASAPAPGDTASTRSPASAPKPPQRSSSRDKMNVEVLIKNAHIHSGPGMEYPIIGTTDLHKKYWVEEWRDQWLKIVLQRPAAKNPTQGKKTAWIRSDLVQQVP
jgi:hypothetical protein